MEDSKKCDHKFKLIVHWDHNECPNCRAVLTDSGHGIASRKWFDNMQQAKFYEKNGFIPS